MAKKVVVSRVDDPTGGSAPKTVPFSLDGKHYEIDLSEQMTPTSVTPFPLLGSARRPQRIRRGRRIRPRASPASRSANRTKRSANGPAQKE